MTSENVLRARHEADEDSVTQCIHYLLVDDYRVPFDDPWNVHSIHVCQSLEPTRKPKCDASNKVQTVASSDNHTWLAMASPLAALLTRLETNELVCMSVDPNRRVLKRMPANPFVSLSLSLQTSRTYDCKSIRAMFLPLLLVFRLAHRQRLQQFCPHRDTQTSSPRNQPLLQFGLLNPIFNKIDLELPGSQALTLGIIYHHQWQTMTIRNLAMRTLSRPSMAFPNQMPQPRRHLSWPISVNEIRKKLLSRTPGRIRTFTNAVIIY